MNDIQAVILAGGQGKRLGTDLPKCMLDLHGKKLIDICIENLILNGFNEYTFLLGYKYDLVVKHLSKYTNMKIRYSIDADTSVSWGKGKALKHAILNGTIDRNKRALVTFPDDIILDTLVYKKLIKEHLNAVNKYNVSATVILASGTRYPYGTAKLYKNNLIYEFEEKPFINIPTNIGIYIFEPDVYDLIIQNIDLNHPEPLELESIIMPILAKEGKLNGFLIDAKKWLPINTKKDYDTALKIFAVH
ncbi:MAG: nucleotidyltransferase [Candidatus Nitrosocaldaceae archaeon]|nr:MAG: nucleotidyltransferase [Candidatus Nitrosocaldaceae archaeon]